MIACLSLPYFATAVERRVGSPLQRRPLVIGGQSWEAKPLYAFSQEVAQRGVRPGMLLRQAHLLSPHSHFLPADQPRYYSTSGEIVDFLLDFTSRLQPEDLWQPQIDKNVQQTTWGRVLPARYTIDLESLPDAEAIPLAREIGRSLREERKLSPALGLAEHPFAAQMAAALARPNHLRAVAPARFMNFFTLLRRDSLQHYLIKQWLSLFKGHYVG